MVELLPDPLPLPEPPPLSPVVVTGPLVGAGLLVVAGPTVVAEPPPPGPFEPDPSEPEPEFDAPDVLDSGAEVSTVPSMVVDGAFAGALLEGAGPVLAEGGVV